MYKRDINVNQKILFSKIIIQMLIIYIEIKYKNNKYLDTIIEQTNEYYYSDTCQSDWKIMKIFLIPIWQVNKKKYKKTGWLISRSDWYVINNVIFHILPPKF